MTMNVYIIRHQAAGYIPEYIFAATPSQQQMAAVYAMCDQRYGLTHPKTQERYWIRWVAIPLQDASDLPMPGDQDTANFGGNAVGAAVPGPVMSATGTVTNPE